jgi:hypothetical protein
VVALEKPNNTNRATARALLQTEYIFFSRPDVKVTTDRLLRVPPDGRQTEAAQGAVEPESGTKREDENCPGKPPQSFLEEFSTS